jgi:hypothetical protein
LLETLPDEVAAVWALLNHLLTAPPPSYTESQAPGASPASSPTPRARSAADAPTTATGHPATPAALEGELASFKAELSRERMLSHALQSKLFHLNRESATLRESLALVEEASRAKDQTLGEMEKDLFYYRKKNKDLKEKLRQLVALTQQQQQQRAAPGPGGAEGGGRSVCLFPPIVSEGEGRQGLTSRPPPSEARHASLAVS